MSKGHFCANFLITFFWTIGFVGLLLFFGLSRNGVAQMNGAGSSSKPNFSAISGETEIDNHDTWESYYRRKSAGVLSPAVEIVQEFSSRLPKSAKILCPAMGEGRNALFLAKKGFEVVGNDISETAVQKVRAEAHLQKIKIETKIEDLFKSKFEPAAFDAVVLSYFYIPELNSKWRQSIKPGGYLVTQQRIRSSKKRRKDIPDEFSIEADEIEKAFSSWKIIIKKEIPSKDGISVGLVFQKPKN